MTKTDTAPRKSCGGLGWPLLWTVLVLYVLDQITKWLVVLNFHPPFRFVEDGKTYGQLDQVPVIDGFFNIVRVHNTGVAFGFGNGTVWSTYVFLAIPLIAAGVILYLFRTGKLFVTPLMRFCGALILAGVLGNLTDRLVQGFFLPGTEQFSFGQKLASGYVVDFIDVVIPGFQYHWPSFNVADSCITIAAVLLFFCSFKATDTQNKPGESEGEDRGKSEKTGA